MKSRVWFTFILISLLISSLLIGCGDEKAFHKDKPAIIRNNDFNDISNIQNDYHFNKHLNFAISAKLSPRENFKQYKGFIRYLSKKLGMPIHLKQRKTYDEINHMIKSGAIDLAFISSGAYVHASENIPMDLLAIPRVNGKTTYQAYIIANKSLNITKLEDLLGNSFAYTDPLSNTGFLYIQSRLSEIGAIKDEFFSKTIFTFSHGYSIESVERQIVDAASVDGRIYDYYQKVYPDKVKNITIIEISEPFGMPPIVAGPYVDSELKSRIKEILFGMADDNEGKEILAKLFIDKFVAAHDDDYSSIRASLKLQGN